MKIKRFFMAMLYLSLMSLPVWADQKIKIVTTTPTFASIVREVAGDDAEIYSIASPNRDIHFISPTPKDVLKVKKADVFVHGGLDLEAWRGPLLDAAGRTDLMPPNGERAIDVSKGIPLLEIPDSLSRSQGDIHAFGNPHYWTDPVNAEMVADNIAEGLARIFPQHADFFRGRAGAFKNKIDAKLQEWEKEMAPYRGTPVVTYHKSWSYFAERFGLEVADQLEPKPGIPPTAKHLTELAKVMKEKKIKLLIQETYYEHQTARKIAKETGATVLELVQSVDEIKEARDYVSMVDYNLYQIEKTLKGDHP